MIITITISQSPSSSVFISQNKNAPILLSPSRSAKTRSIQEPYAHSFVAKHPEYGGAPNARSAWRLCESTSGGRVHPKDAPAGAPGGAGGAAITHFRYILRL